MCAPFTIDTIVNNYFRVYECASFVAISDISVFSLNEFPKVFHCAKYMRSLSFSLSLSSWYIVLINQTNYVISSFYCVWAKWVLYSPSKLVEYWVLNKFHELPVPYVHSLQSTFYILYTYCWTVSGIRQSFQYILINNSKWKWMLNALYRKLVRFSFRHDLPLPTFTKCQLIYELEARLAFFLQKRILNK